MNAASTDDTLGDCIFETVEVALPVMICTTARLRSVGALLALLLAAAITASPALAGPPTAAPGNSASAVTAGSDAGPAPTDAELDDFARAIVATGNIKRDASPGIEGAPTPADRTSLEQAATRKIKAAIRNNHLSVHRYLQIVAFVQAHPAAQKKVVALLKSLMPPLPPE